MLHRDRKTHDFAHGRYMVLGLRDAFATRQSPARKLRAQRNQGYATRDVAVERCQVVNERVTEQVVDGYWVTYQYQGRQHTMQTATHPGDRVRLAVDIRPVGYRVRY